MTTKAPPRFLALPPEVRQNVYQHLFQDITLHIGFSWLGTLFPCRRFKQVAAIWMTCRQCYDEAFSSCIKHCLVICGLDAERRSSLEKVPSRIKQNVHSLKVVELFNDDDFKYPEDLLTLFPRVQELDLGVRWLARYEDSVPAMQLEGMSDEEICDWTLRNGKQLEIEYDLSMHLECSRIKTYISIMYHVKPSDHCELCFGRAKRQCTISLHDKKVIRYHDHYLVGSNTQYRGGISDAQQAKMILKGLVEPPVPPPADYFLCQREHTEDSDLDLDPWGD